MVSVVPDDAEDRPSRGEVSHGDAPDDPLLPREVDVVRRGHEPPVDGSGHQAGHEPLRPVDAAPLGVLLYHHRPGGDRIEKNSVGNLPSHFGESDNFGHRYICFTG